MSVTLLWGVKQLLDWIFGVHHPSEEEVTLLRCTIIPRIICVVSFPGQSGSSNMILFKWSLVYRGTTEHICVDFLAAITWKCGCRHTVASELSFILLLPIFSVTWIQCVLYPNWRCVPGLTDASASNNIENKTKKQCNGPTALESAAVGRKDSSLNNLDQYYLSSQ